jgi:hypothetical protein
LLLLTLLLMMVLFADPVVGPVAGAYRLAAVT